MLSLMRNLAEELHSHNYLRGQKLQTSYRIWLASLLVAVLLLVLAYA